MPCLFREKGTFHQLFDGWKTPAELGEHPLDLPGWELETASQFPEIGGGIKSVRAKLRGFKIPKELQCGSAFDRKMNICVEEVVSRGKRHVSIRTFQQGKILQVRISIADQIIKRDKPEKLENLDAGSRAKTVEQFTDFLIAGIVFKIWPPGVRRPSRESGKWSGRQDSNLRPPGPKPGALPS